MIKIKNKVVDLLAKNNFSSYQIRVLFAIYKIHSHSCEQGYILNPGIIRYCHEKENFFNSRIAEITGLTKSHVSRTLKELREMHILIQSGKELVINK